MSGDLLASVTVPSGTATELANQFEFVSLSTPVNLLAGQSYVLGASFLNDDGDYFIVNFGGNQAGFDSAIVPGDIRYIQDGGFTFPSSDDVFGSEIGPNVEFTVVPEPSSALLMLVFSAAILLARLVGRVTRRKVKIL
jgi:hypothetical protein